VPLARTLPGSYLDSVWRYGFARSQFRRLLIAGFHLGPVRRLQSCQVEANTVMAILSELFSTSVGRPGKAALSLCSGSRH
jgi:hypothetical protein